VGYTTRTVLGAGSLLPLGRAGWLGLHGKPPRLGPLRTGDPHFLSVLSLVPLAIWNVLVARRLFRLGREDSEEVKLARSKRR
jgi:hypothetical protein